MTPEALVEQVAAEHPRCFWLDGAGGRDWSGRRSVVGWLDEDDVSLSYDAARREVTRHEGGRSRVVGDDVFAVLGAELARGSSSGSSSGEWVGWFGYASHPHLPARPDPQLPDAVWMRARHLRTVEHPAAVPAAPAAPTGLAPVVPVVPVVDGTSAPTPGWYVDDFARVQGHLHAGDCYEVNLTHREERASDRAPLEVYLALRATSPAPYAGFLQHDVDGARGWLLSASPERFATIGADGTVETRPIKGTTPRGATPAEDSEQRRLLAEHPRYRAESLMIVDLLRNDLARVCEVGSVQVPSLMAVESYAAVHQLVSVVRGRLRPGVSTMDAVASLFPTGSMTGAPKLRTMSVIDAVERSPRGVYAGAFGRLHDDGRADLGVVIRSLTTAGDGRYRLGTGGGVTVHSDVDAEWAETGWKAEALLRASGPPTGTAADPGS